MDHSEIQTIQDAKKEALKDLAEQEKQLEESETLKGEKSCLRTL